MTRVLLALALLGVLAIALVQSSPSPSATVRPGRGDLAFHRAVTERVRNGEPYYDVVAAELRTRHYPMRSMFNWRPPLLTWFQSMVPEIVTHWILFGAVIALCLFAGTAPNREAPIAAVLLIGAILMPPLLHETWAGLLLGFSVVAYLRDWRVTGALLGAGAVFIRELAAPYAVLCAGLSGVRGRTREFAVWVAAGIACGVYFWRHALHVSEHIAPTDLAQTASWVQFGGMRFLMNAIYTTSWLPLLPHTATAAGVVLLMAVVISPRTPLILRAALVTYGAFFFVAGQPFNWYWGLMVSPLASIALAHAPTALKTLFESPRPKVATAGNRAGAGPDV